MRESIETLLKKYQVRKSQKEKAAFADWLEAHLNEKGYALKREEYAKEGTNLIVGDAKKADVLFTAHYDTQPNFFIPVLMGFSNWGFFLVSQLIAMAPMLLIVVLQIALIRLFPGNPLAMLLPLFGIIAYGVQIMVGVANKHTANDNTSGVAALIAILEDLPLEDREKVCVVFFDQEELGLIGSKHFFNKHKADVKNKTLINFDCVSDGEMLTFVMKKRFRESADCARLKAACEKTIGKSEKKLNYLNAALSPYMSDQLHFEKGVGVVAAKKSPFGYYINRLHSKWDTRFDNGNIEGLKAAMLEMIHNT